MRAVDVLTKPIQKYRQSINPPYTKKDLISILGTLFILLVIPLTVVLVQQAREPVGRSENIDVYQVPVLVLKYFPTQDGTHLDRDETAIPDKPELPDKTLDEMRTKTDTIDSQLIQALEKGSAYRGYGDSDATPSLEYSTHETMEFLQPVPLDIGRKKVIDGDPTTGKWSPAPPFANDYLMVHLSSIQQIDKITLHFWSFDKPEKFHIDVSTTGEFTGEEQTVVTELDGLSGGTGKEYPFSSTSARYIKLVVDTYREGGSDAGMQINLYEFGISYEGVALDLSDADVSANEGLRLVDPADHRKILGDINICNYVEKLGVKEVWIWMYHTDKVYPVESYQRGPYGGFGNGYMDLPLCQKTYTVYDYNYGRELGEALEDHTHHIEHVLNWIEDRNSTPGDQWQNLLFWGKFVGSDVSHRIINPGCGWTHYPPNGAHDYDWYNENPVQSDCEDWEPDGTGEQVSVSCHTWSEGLGCSNTLDPFKDGKVGFLVWWMQNIPGKDNSLIYDGSELRNWWHFIGDFDAAMVLGKSLTKPDTHDPTVSITSPGDGVIVSGTVNVAATATDTVGVTKVEFYVDGTLKSTDTTSPYSYSWDTTEETNELHTLLAKAHDAAGNVGTSPEVEVTVSNLGTPSPPTVDIKAGGSNGPITVVFNQKATLSWTSTNTTSCTASGAWSGSKSTSGSQSTPRLTSNKTYTLTCTGLGGTESDSMVVRAAKKGDLNKDGKINIFDLSMLLSRWRRANTIADINASGKVDIFDLSILLSRWGR
jgi:hypothetical protein